MAIRRLGVVTAVLCFAFAFPAMAQELKDPFEGMSAARRLLRGARLTDSQVQQIRDLRAPTRAQEKEIEKQIDALYAQFDDLYTGTAPVDRMAELALLDEWGALRVELDHMKTETMLKIRELLTPEQASRVAQVHLRVKAMDAEKKAFDPTIASEQ